MQNKKQIFKKGSKTFFYSTLFFPKNIKEDVSTLYAFVRVADDFVDTVPALREEFDSFKNNYYQALGGESKDDNIIEEFILLQKKYNFNQEWIDGFLYAMESDLNFTKCLTLSDTEKYMYGSAEVVGLMMSKILGLNIEAYPYASRLGQAFQYINFIRDIAEDNTLNRQYLPEENLKKYNLENLSLEYIKNHQDNFEKFLRKELDYFYELIQEAKLGFKFIPLAYRIPIMIATNLYIYTAGVIYKNPMIVYTKKVKPGKFRIFYEALKVIFKN